MITLSDEVGSTSQCSFVLSVLHQIPNQADLLENATSAQIRRWQHVVNVSWRALNPVHTVGPRDITSTSVRSSVRLSICPDRGVEEN